MINPHTLGFKLVNNETTALYDVCHPFIGGTEKIKDITSYLSKLFLVLAFREESEHHIRTHDQLRTVYIYDLGIQGTEFSLDPSKLEMLIENGRKGFQLFVKKRVLEHGQERMRELSVMPHKGPRYIYSIFSTYDAQQALDILTRSNMSVYEVDENGNTALHICGFLDDVSTCQKLLEIGMNPAFTNAAGKTPSDIALVFHCKNVLKLLTGYMTEHKLL